MGRRDVCAFNPKQLDLALAARRFECGTPAIPNIYMARAALKLLDGIGMENIAAQVERLTRAFLEGARELRIESKTPSSSIGPLVVLRSHDASAMLAKLTTRGIVVSTRRDGVRFAFHVYNTMEDVHTALSALEDNLDLMVRA